jgi:hypothetical protein
LRNNNVVEFFNNTKVERLARAINELEGFIIKYGEIADDLSDIYSNIEMLTAELVEYCNKFRKNYRMFFQSRLDHEVKRDMRGEKKCVGVSRI